MVAFFIKPRITAGFFSGCRADQAAWSRSWARRCMASSQRASRAQPPSVLMALVSYPKALLSARGEFLDLLEVDEDRLKNGL